MGAGPVGLPPPPNHPHFFLVAGSAWVPVPVPVPPPAPPPPPARAPAWRLAFPDGRRGSIAVAFSRATDGLSLVVRDSGIGAETLEPGEGLSMVQGLVEHLGGTMSIETALEAGVGVRLRLPLDGASTH